MVKTAKESEVFSSFERDLIFTKSHDTIAYMPEDKQIIWENLVSDNIQKSGYNVRTDTLKLQIKTVFYTNENYVPLPVEDIRKSYKIQQDLLNRLGIKIKFIIHPIKVVLGKPENVPEYVKSDYYSYGIDYFSLIAVSEDALTVVIYNDHKTDNIGMSYGIPSSLIKLELKGLDPAYSTVAHEVFHALGLYHTHKLDTSKEKYSYTDGDMIGDTPVSCPLTNLIDTDCTLKKNHNEIRSLLEVREMYRYNKNTLDKNNKKEIKLLSHNIMSYTYKLCRDTLSNEQVNKVFFTIQTNKDVRDMFSNFDKGDYLKEIAEKVKAL